MPPVLYAEIRSVSAISLYRVTLAIARVFMPPLVLAKLKEQP